MYLALLALALLPSATLSQTGWPASGAELCVLPSTASVTPHSTCSAHASSTAGGCAAPTANVLAQLGETEDVQLLLRKEPDLDDPIGGLRNVTVKVAAPTGVVASVFRVGYVFAHHSPRYAGSGGGWRGDPLLPLSEGGAFDVPPSVAQGIWISLRVMHDAAPGALHARRLNNRSVPLVQAAIQKQHCRNLADASPSRVTRFSCFEHTCGHIRHAQAGGQRHSAVRRGHVRWRWRACGAAARPDHGNHAARAGGEQDRHGLVWLMGRRHIRGLLRARLQLDRKQERLVRSYDRQPDAARFDIHQQAETARPLAPQIRAPNGSRRRFQTQAGALMPRCGSRAGSTTTSISPREESSASPF